MKWCAERECRRVVRRTVVSVDDEATPDSMQRRVLDLGHGECMIDGEALFVKCYGRNVVGLAGWGLVDEEDTIVVASLLYDTPQTGLEMEAVMCAARSMCLENGRLDVRCLRGMSATQACNVLRRVSSAKVLVLAAIAESESRSMRARRRSASDGLSDGDLAWLGVQNREVLVIKRCWRNLEDLESREELVSGFVRGSFGVRATYPTLDGRDSATVSWRCNREDSVAALCAPPIDGIEHVHLELDATWEDDGLLRDIEMLLDVVSGQLSHSSLTQQRLSDAVALCDDEALWPALPDHILRNDIPGARSALDAYVATISSGQLFPILPDDVECDLITALRLSRQAAASLRYGTADPAGDFAAAAAAVNAIRRSVARVVADFGLAALVSHLAKRAPASVCSCQQPSREYARRLSRAVQLQERARRAGCRRSGGGEVCELDSLAPSLRAILAEPSEWTCSVGPHFLRVITTPDRDAFSFNTKVPLAALKRAHAAIAAKPSFAASVVRCLLGLPNPRAALAVYNGASKKVDSTSVSKHTFKPLVLVASRFTFNPESTLF